MAASSYHVISKEVENHIFRHNWIFRHISMYKQPTLTKYGNYIFSCKYDIVISHIPVGSFLDVLFFLPTVILSELHERPRRKDWVTEKSTQKNLCEGNHFFDWTPSFLCHFLSLSLSSPSPFPIGVLPNGLYKGS